MDALIQNMWDRIRRMASATILNSNQFGKESPMDEETTKAVQTAVAEAVEGATAKLTEAAAGAAKAAVDAAIAPVVERLGKVETAAKPAADAAGDDTGKPLSREQLDKAFADRDAAAATKADEAKTEKAKTDAAAAYAAEKMKDLPEVYQAKLPATDDATKLAAAEQEIRKGFKADMESVGVKLPDVGKPAGDGKSAGSVEPDLGKMSPAQMIAAGFEEDAAGQSSEK